MAEELDDVGLAGAQPEGAAGMRARAAALRARADARQATIDELERMGPALIDRLAAPVASLRKIGGLPPKDLHTLVEERLDS